MRRAGRCRAVAPPARDPVGPRRSVGPVLDAVLRAATSPRSRREEGRSTRDLGLRRGLFSGDAGLANPAYRAEIEEAWGLVARNIYGTSETAPVAAECDAADGLHWMGQAAFLAEFVDPLSGDPVRIEDGATAELVVTTLRREAHPLIRFRTHDHVRLIATPCRCGRTSIRFSVLGRSDDMFIVRGINVFPLAVQDVIDQFRPALTGEFRIVLAEPPPLMTPPLLRVEHAADLAPDERGRAGRASRRSDPADPDVHAGGRAASVRQPATERTQDATRRPGVAGGGGMSDTGSLIVERSGRVAILRLNRPRVLNALDPELVGALTAAVDAAAADPDVGCVVIEGEGRSFSVGGDLTAMLEMDAASFRAYIEQFQALSRIMWRLPVPTIAALHGHVLAGGFELAIECDIRVAADDAVFGLPDTRIGLSPTSGMSWLLPRIVGEGWARHLLLTGESIDARAAERIGLVTRVTARANLDEAVRSMAASIADQPPEALRQIRRVLDGAANGTLEEALAAELEAELACFATPEFQAGLRAFRDRRKRTEPTPAPGRHQ